MKVEIGFDLSANGQGSYFTLDDATKGKLDDVTYVLGGDVMVDVTSKTRVVSTKRGRSRTLDKFTAGAANVTLDNRDRAFDPTYAPTTTTRTNLCTNPSVEVDATGWTATSETSDNLEAKAVLATATLWLDAQFSTSSQTVPNLGTAGATLNGQLGSTSGSDSNDPQWLPYDSQGKYLYLPGGSNSVSCTAPASVSSYAAYPLGGGAPTTGAATGGAAFTFSTSGSWLRVDLLTAGSAVVASFVVNAGNQTSLTDVYGVVWAVNRATSGRKTACVVGPCWLLGTDDYIECPSDSSINFDGSTSLTYLAIIRQHATPVSNAVIMGKRDTTPSNLGYTMRQSGTGFGVSGVNIDGTNAATANSPTLSAGTLAVYAVTVDRSTNFVTAYANGTAGTPVSSSAVGSLSNSYAFRVGRLGGASTSYCDFELVAVAVFRSALTAGQIQTISDYYSGRAVYGTAACTRVSGGVYGTYGGSATNTTGYSTLGVVYASATVTAGTAYTGSLYMKGTTASAKVVLDWYGASGYISRSTGTAAAGNATAWTRYSATGTAPTGATSVQVRLDMPANATTPVYVDSALVESGSTLGGYFDGTYSDGSIRYTSRAWSGATDASTSTITAYVTGTGSPYYGSILPRKAIRISRDDQVMFSGLTADWNFGYTLGGDSVADVSCTDGFALLAGQTRTAGTATPQASGARIAAVLTEAGWPLTQRTLSAGQASLGADVIADTDNALAYIQQVGTTEPGQVFIGKTGNVVFKDRADLQSPTSSVTFGTGGLPFTDIGVEYGIENLVTKANIAYTGGTVTVENATASALYGTLEQTYDTLLSSSTDATALGNWLISQYSAPQYRINKLTVNLLGLTSAQVLTVLGLEIGDTATVTWTPNGTGSALTKFVIIDGIEHSADPGSHTVTFALSPTSAAFVLDSAYFGLLDTSALGF